MIQHNFIAIDEGFAALLHIDEKNPSKNWKVPVGHPEARDMQLIGNNRILIGHRHGYNEFDITTGEVKREYAELDGVTAACRQPNGNTVLAGIDLLGKNGVSILELDSKNKMIRRADFEGDYVRLIRQTRDNTFLMSCNDRIKEGNWNGEYIRQYPVEGFLHAWKSLRLENGNLLISAGYGAFMVELDQHGKTVRKFGHDLPESIRPFFFAMFQLMPNGNIILANWQGHGEDMGKSGTQLLEFDKDQEIVWSWSESNIISSLQGILVLDGLDTSKLHNEQYGIIKPA